MFMIMITGTLVLSATTNKINVIKNVNHCRVNLNVHKIHSCLHGNSSKCRHCRSFLLTPPRRNVFKHLT